MNKRQTFIATIVTAGASALTAGAVLAADTAPLPGSDTPDLMMAGIKMIGAMLLVIGALLAALYLTRRLGNARKGLFGNREMIKILGTRALAPKKYLTVVEVGDRVLTLGVTAEGISCLDKVPAARFHAAMPTEEPTTEKSSFLQILRTAKTGKSSDGGRTA